MFRVYSRSRKIKGVGATACPRPPELMQTILKNNEKFDEYTRKNSLCLQGFDYSSSRVYFVTINVLNRKTLFYNKEFAEDVVDSLLNLRQSLQFNLYCYCLMPDHFHALIGIGNSEKDLAESAAHLKV